MDWLRNLLLVIRGVDSSNDPVFYARPAKKKTNIATALYVAEGGIVSVGVENRRDVLRICGISGGG